MSRYLCEDLSEGDMLEFKHIDFNVKKQAPFSTSRSPCSLEEQALRR